MALIDKETIRKEIERRIKLHYKEGIRVNADRIDEDEIILAWLDSLPEQPKLKPMNISSAGSGAMGTTPPKFKLDVKPEQPVEWKDEYREEDLRTRFAFYTYKNEEDDGVLYLSNVFVEEASRNAGFGTKILEAAEKVAETIGAITIRLKVKQDSPANAWYRKRGYGYIAFEGEYDWLEKNLEYLKPKRNGQPVDGLDAEIDKYFDGWFNDAEYGQAVMDESRGFLCAGVDDCKDIARHFAEWGRKQVLQEIYDGKVKPVDKITAAWLIDEQNT